MRLIKVADLSMCPDEVDEDRTFQQYAILSHTWDKDDQELVFSDFIPSVASETPGTLEPEAHWQNTWKTGFKKLENFSQVAKEHRIDHAWMDTCCIDKSSSTELQLSLNSMFRWYERSALCVVYLSDFELEMKDDFQVSKSFLLQVQVRRLFELLKPTSPKTGSRGSRTVNGFSAAGLSRSLLPRCQIAVAFMTNTGGGSMLLTDLSATLTSTASFKKRPRSP